MGKTCWLVTALLLGVGTRHAAAQSSMPAEMTINSYSVAGLTGLNSDGNGAYIDNSLSGGNPCVTAQVASNGIFSNRIDFNSLIYPSDCDAALSPSPVRAYILRLQDLTACQAVLGSNASSPCSITVEGNTIDKIFAGTLFAKTNNASVLFDFVYPASSSNTYRVKTQNPATVSGSGATRTATYSGDATLYKVGSNGKLQQVGSSFIFPFQFTVTEK